MLKAFVLRRWNNRAEQIKKSREILVAMHRDISTLAALYSGWALTSYIYVHKPSEKTKALEQSSATSVKDYKPQDIGGMAALPKDIRDRLAAAGVQEFLAGAIELVLESDHESFKKNMASFSEMTTRVRKAIMDEIDRLDQIAV